MTAVHRKSKSVNDFGVRGEHENEHVVISTLLQRYSQEMSTFLSFELTTATRMTEIIITTTVTEKTPIKINFWRKGIRTRQNITTGIEMTVLFD